MAQTLHSYVELNKDFSLHLTCTVIPIVKTPLKLKKAEFNYYYYEKLFY